MQRGLAGHNLAATELDTVSVQSCAKRSACERQACVKARNCILITSTSYEVVARDDRRASDEWLGWCLGDTRRRRDVE